MRSRLLLMFVLTFPASFACRKSEPDPEPKPDPKPAPVVEDKIEPNFKSELADFKMWLPGKPAEKTEGDVPQCFWTSPDGKGSILIVKIKTETPRSPMTDAENLKELVRLTMPFKNHTEESRKDFRIGEDAVLEVRGTLEDKQAFILQTILVGKEHYFQISVVGEPSFIASKDVRDALASFRSLS